MYIAYTCDVSVVIAENAEVENAGERRLQGWKITEDVLRKAKSNSFSSLSIYVEVQFEIM